jgi:hypothetical protein
LGRLLDLNRDSRLDQIEAALAALGTSPSILLNVPQGLST